MTVQCKKLNKGALWLVLGGAFVLRLLLAAITTGYSYDMGCFGAWAAKMAQTGPAAFYSDGYFADYPPGYLYVLGAVGAVQKIFWLDFDGAAFKMLLALVPAVCDCAAAWLVAQLGQRCLPAGRGVLCLTAFAALHPAALFDTAVWKQIDGAFTLPILLCFLLLETKNYLPAAIFYGVALSIKPQALLFGPVLAACFLAGIVLEQDRLRAFGRCFAGAALAVLPVLAAGLPFFGLRGLLPGLLDKYTGTVSGYPYASVNAFNWLAALGGNWQSIYAPALGGISWRTVGMLGLLLVTATMAFFAYRSAVQGRFSPLLLAGFYGAGVFTLAHCMHERYLVPAALLLLLAAVRWNDIRVYAAAVGFSLTSFLNLAVAYTVVDTDDMWLSSAVGREITLLGGLGETICFVLLVFAVWDIAVNGHTTPITKERSFAQNWLEAPAPRPKWQPRELLALAGLTLATAAVSFCYLGSMTAPQNPLDATGTVLTVDVVPQQEVSGVWLYPGISDGGSVRITDDAGAVLLEQPLSYSTCFCWTNHDLTAAAGEVLHITVENAQLFEVSLRSGAGAAAVSGGGAAFDEPNAVPTKISQLNSMYFDEIYHARTGYEQLHALRVYETTHPPLGKDCIMLSIALFGMTGFGWRFAGTLFGVLLVPLAWCFARRLTGKRWAGAAAGVLLALDFMRFSQSRLATIDVYATFFILLGAHCMVWYCQSVLQKGVLRSLLPMVLGGAAFGFGCAAKWTGIYAGAGLAVLYLGVLYLRRRQDQPDFGREFAAAAAGGVGFYVLLPLGIYLASYLPYRWRDPDFGLEKWWQCQLSMYSYHSQLKATHPFESRWYSWIFGLRPVWYYRNDALTGDVRASIAGLAGPVICLGGLVCLLWIFWRTVSGRGSRQGAAVLVLYAAQMLPWMLVTRCTFQYHYFPGLMFCLAGLVLVLARIPNERTAKRMATVLCGASLILFVWYYPALAGVPVPRLWWQSLEIWPSYGFY